MTEIVTAQGMTARVKHTSMTKIVIAQRAATSVNKE